MREVEAEPKLSRRAREAVSCFEISLGEGPRMKGLEERPMGPEGRCRGGFDFGDGSSSMDRMHSRYCAHSLPTSVLPEPARPVSTMAWEEREENRVE